MLTKNDKINLASAGITPSKKKQVKKTVEAPEAAAAAAYVVIDDISLLEPIVGDAKKSKKKLAAIKEVKQSEPIVVDVKKGKKKQIKVEAPIINEDVSSIIVFNKSHRRISLKEYQNSGSLSTFCFVGSVAAGKTALCEFLTGRDTKKFSSEQLNGCTVKMGHASLRIYYNGTDFLLNPKIIPNGFRLIRHFSIADNPGHNSFMTTMVTGTSTIDNALFLISGKTGLEKQTEQHMRCFKSTNISDLAIIVSKIDLVSTREYLDDLIDKIDEFMTEQDPDQIYDPPIIPLSSIEKINTDFLIKYLVSSPYPKNIINLIDKPLNMTIIRSFDVNKPGTSIFDIKGAVFGGSIQEGFLTIGDVICVLPGIIEVLDGVYTYTPLITQVTSLRSDTTDLEVALPGGFIGVSTTLDPSYGKNNRMVGNIIVKINNKEDITNVCDVTNIIFVSDVTNLIEQDLIEDNDYLIVIHGSEQIAKLVSISNGIYKFILNRPLATIIGERVAILTKVGNTIEMVSYGKINSVKKSDNIVMDLPIDIDDFFQNLPVVKEINTIELVNDLDIFPESESEKYKDQLMEVKTTSANIKFERKKYAINCDYIKLEKTTTSVAISNAIDIMSNFTDDANILKKLCNDYATFVKTSINTLKQSSIKIIDKSIVFNGLRNTKQSAATFTSLLDLFINSKFKCSVCNEIGSVFFDSKKTYCRSCNAILSKS